MQRWRHQKAHCQGAHMNPKLNATANIYQGACTPTQVCPITLRQASIPASSRRWGFRPTAENRKALEEAQRKDAARPDTMVALNHRARGATPIEDEAINDILHRALGTLENLRTKGEVRPWLDLVVLVRYLVAIQQKGSVLIDAGVIVKAYDALLAIQTRHYDPASDTWSPIKMLAPEIANLEKAIHHNGAQLLNLTHAQFNEAYELGKKWTFEHLSSVIERMRINLPKS